MARRSIFSRGKKWLGRKLVFWQTTLNYMRRFELRYLKAAAAVRPGECLLDIACGIGVFSATLGRSGAYTVGLDMNDSAIRLAAVLEIPRASFLVANAHTLPLRTQSFENVVSICALEHFEDDGAALREMHRVLKPGGRLLLTVDSLNHPLISEADRMLHADRHAVRTFYTPALLTERLEQAGFSVDRTRYLITSGGAVRLARIALRLIPHASLSRWFSVIGVPLGYACECIAGRTDRGLTLGAVAVKRPAP